MASDIGSPISPGYDVSTAVQKEKLKHDFEIKALERRVADEHAVRLRIENKFNQLLIEKDSLESDSAAMYENMLEKQQELGQKINFYEEEVAKACAKASQLATELNAAKADLVDKSMEISSAKLEVEQIQAKLDNNEREKDANELELRKEVDVLRIELAARTQEVASLTTQLESAKQESSSHEVFSGQLSEYVAKTRDLEQELAQTRKAAHEGQLAKDLNLFLEEEKAQLKRDIQTLGHAAEENRSLQEKLAKVEAEKEVWAVYLRGHPGLSSPQELAKKVSNLEVENRSLQAKIQSIAEGPDRKSNDQSDLLAKKQIELETAEDELSETKIKLTRRDFEIDNLRKEIQLLEAHLDKKSDGNLQARLDQAVATIDGLRQQVAELEKSSSEATKSANSKKRRASEAMLTERRDIAVRLEAAETELEEKTKQLQTTTLDLESSKKVIEQLQLSAQTLPSKVAEVKGSPFEAEFASKQAKLTALEREVEDLRKLQEEHFVPEYVPRSSLLTLKVDYDAVKEQCARQEAKYQSFQKAHAIRDARLTKAISQLFGYRLELLADRTCIVKPELNSEVQFEAQFDDIDRHYTDFRVTDDLRQFDSLYKYWVQGRRCLPGFLSATVLEMLDSSNQNQQV